MSPIFQFKICKQNQRTLNNIIMKQFLFFLFILVSTIHCYADTWTRAQQSLSPMITINEWSDDNHVKHKDLLLKMRNPYSAVEMPLKDARLLVKFSDGSILELRGRQVDKNRIEPLFSTDENAPMQFIGGMNFQRVYSVSGSHKLGIADASYMINTVMAYALTDEQVAKIKSVPIVKWRVELSGGKYIDYDVSPADAQKVLETL